MICLRRLPSKGMSWWHSKLCMVLYGRIYREESGIRAAARYPIDHSASRLLRWAPQQWGSVSTNILLLIRGLLWPIWGHFQSPMGIFQPHPPRPVKSRVKRIVILRWTGLATSVTTTVRMAGMLWLLDQLIPFLCRMTTNLTNDTLCVSVRRLFLTAFWPPRILTCCLDLSKSGWLCAGQLSWNKRVLLPTIWIRNFSGLALFHRYDPLSCPRMVSISVFNWHTASFFVKAMALWGILFDSIVARRRLILDQTKL